MLIKITRVFQLVLIISFAFNLPYDLAYFRHEQYSVYGSQFAYLKLIFKWFLSDAWLLALVLALEFFIRIEKRAAEKVSVQDMPMHSNGNLSDYKNKDHQVLDESFEEKT